MFLLCSVPALAQSTRDADVACFERKGCHHCALTRHVDGDTIHVSCAVLPDGGTEDHALRLFGIDTPEVGAHAKCDLERERGEAASAYLRQWIPIGSYLQVLKVDVDRYGRWVGLVRYKGNDVSAELSWLGYARPWVWRTPKPNWCE